MSPILPQCSTYCATRTERSGALELELALVADRVLLGGGGPGRDTGSVYVEGLYGLLRVLNQIDKEMTAEIRDASGALASDFVAGAASRAPSRQNRAALETLSVKRDRVPAVTSKLAWFYGAEFGGGRRATTHQFPPHKGRTGYGFYPYLRAEGRRLADQWAAAVFAVVDRKWHN